MPRPSRYYQPLITLLASDAGEALVPKQLAHALGCSENELRRLLRKLEAEMGAQEPRRCTSYRSR